MKVYILYDNATQEVRGFFSSRKKAENEKLKLQESCREVNDIKYSYLLLYKNSMLPRFIIKSYELNKLIKE